MKKRVLSIFLAVCMCLSLLPVSALADEGEPGMPHDHTADDWTALTYSSGKTLTGGNYYLNGDMSTVGLTISSGEVCLCLNGKTVYSITVNPGANLTICDCSAGETGQVKSTGQAGAAVTVDGGTLTLESGTIYKAHAQGYGVQVKNGGTFRMTGGTVKKAALAPDENFAYSAVDVFGAWGKISTFRLSGGTISGGAYGVKKDYNSMVYLSGTPVIEDVDIAEIFLNTGTEPQVFAQDGDASYTGNVIHLDFPGPRHKEVVVGGVEEASKNLFSFTEEGKGKYGTMLQRHFKLLYNTDEKNLWVEGQPVEVHWFAEDGTTELTGEGYPTTLTAGTGFGTGPEELPSSALVPTVAGKAFIDDWEYEEWNYTKGELDEVWSGSGAKRYSHTILGPMHFKAMYEDARTVTFHANGGQGTMAPQPFIKGEYSKKLTANTFTNGDMVFVGWNTKADGTGTAYKDGAGNFTFTNFTEDITLYAQWMAPHKHAVSVGCETEGDDLVEFTPWTSSNDLPTDTGNYVLTQDVTLSQWNFNGYGQQDVVLCLNGHTITTNNSSQAVYLYKAMQHLTLCDCAATPGKLVAADSATSLFNMNNSNSTTLTILGGVYVFPTGDNNLIKSPYSTSNVSLRGGIFSVHPDPTSQGYVADGKECRVISADDPGYQAGYAGYYIVADPLPETAPVITTDSLPNGIEGASYSQTLAATGGSPITWTVTSGTLPSNLTLNNTTGALVGRLGSSSRGTYTFTVTATNDNGSDSKTYTLVVDPDFDIATVSLPDGTVGTPYTATLEAEGATDTVAWSIWTEQPGTLPDGLNLNTTTGVISGTPTTAGTFSFWLSARSGSNVARAQRSITVHETAPTTYTVTYKDGDAVLATDTADENTDYIFIAKPDGLVKEGYSFVGWRNPNEGTSDVYAPGEARPITADMTFNPVWAKNILRVTDADGTEIGSYPTLELAVENAPDGGTITLFEDSDTEDVGVTLTGKNLTLDFGAYTMSNVAGITVKSGTVTVKATTGGMAGLLNNNGGKLTVDGGTYGSLLDETYADDSGETATNIKSGIFTEFVAVYGTGGDGEADRKAELIDSLLADPDRAEITGNGEISYVPAADGEPPYAMLLGPVSVGPDSATPLSPTITTTSLPGGTVGQAYSQTLTATGDAPITWSITAGALPDGLILNAGTGVISGAPTTAGTATFTVTASNEAGNDSKVLAIQIKAPAPDPTFDVSGTVTDDENPVDGAEVKLVRGKDQIGASVTTGADGVFTFSNVAPGAYNIVATKDTKIVTKLITVTNEDMTNLILTMPADSVNSVLTVTGADVSGAGAKITETVVGGLNDEAAAVKEAHSNASSVTVTMTVQPKTEAEAADNGAAIKGVAGAGKTVEFLEIVVEKKVDSADAQPIEETTTLMQIVIPFDFTNKSNVTVYRHHDGEGAKALSKDSGEEYFTLGDGFITIYAKKFSTYAIGYTTTPSEPEPTPTPGGGSSATTYPPVVEETENGTVTVKPGRPERGDKVTITLIPDEGFAPGGLTVTDKDGKPVAVTDNGDGTYTFTQPRGKVTIAAAFVLKSCSGGENCPSRAFSDLDTGAWYHEGTDYVIEHGLMSGYGNGKFGPDAPLSRGMVVTILWRLEGSPTINYLMDYDDVPQDAYYTEAIRWAAGVGVAVGYGNGCFGPGDEITREQLATILYRYATYKGMTSVTLEDDLVGFSDHEKTSGFAVQAMNWAVGQGLIAGIGNNTLNPTGTATRAQAAMLLTRYCENILK